MVLPVAGKWWRFDRYEIKDRCIRPSPGAKLEAYDPWQEYLTNRRGRQEPLYQSLVEMRNKLIHLPSEAELDKAILAWCQQYGLLGILLQSTYRIVLAPRWETGEELGHGPFTDGAYTGFSPVLRCHVRTGSGWVTRSVQPGPPSIWLAGSIRHQYEGQPVEAKHIPSDWGEPGFVLDDTQREFAGMVIDTELGASMQDRHPFGQNWAVFFPDVPPEQRQSYPYPRPFTEEFWRAYAEPIPMFRQAVVLFRQYLEDLQNPKDEHRFDFGKWMLNRLLGSVTPSLAQEQGGPFKRVWVAPSLLAWFSLMVTEDLLEEKRRILECEVCASPFVSGAHQVRYCSAKCRNTAQKRVYRKRQAAKEKGSRGYARHLQKGLTLLDQAHFQEAAEEFHRATEANPDDADAHNNLGRALRELGHRDEAEAAFRTAIRLDPNHARGHNNLGIILDDRGQYADAEKEYRLALHLDPNLAVAHNNLGMILFKFNRHKEAIKAFEKALQLNPELPEVYNNLGISLDNTHQFEKGIEAFREAIRLKPGYADAYNNLGGSLLMLDRYEEALAAYQAAVRLDPQVGGLHYGVGLAATHLGKYEEAIRAYHNALELNPRLAQAYSGLGNVYLAIRRYEDATKAYSQALEINPTSAAVYTNLGATLVAMGRHKDAIGYYQTALRLDPTLVYAHFNYGNTLVYLGKYDEAMAAFQRALDLDHRLAQAHNNIGNIFYVQGRYRKAAAKYRAALRVNPEFVEAQDNLRSTLQALEGEMPEQPIRPAQLNMAAEPLKAAIGL